MINLSPIADRLPSIAFALFRDWNKVAAPSRTIAIKGEGKLVEELREAVTNALLALREKEDLDLRPLGWDIGFVLGFIEGHLLKGWYHEYMVKNSKVYKLFAGLKAMETYLQSDQVALLRTEALYRQFLEADSNLLEIKPEIFKQKLESESTTFITSDESGQFLPVLNNLISDQIKRMTAEKIDVKLPVRDYFSVEEIQSLIWMNL